MSDQLFIGTCVVFVGTIFGFIETLFFGNNLFPQSGSELFCDLIALLIILIGVRLVLMSKESKRYFKK